MCVQLLNLLHSFIVASARSVQPPPPPPVVQYTVACRSGHFGCIACMITACIACITQQQPVLPHCINSLAVLDLPVSLHVLPVSLPVLLPVLPVLPALLTVLLPAVLKTTCLRLYCLYNRALSVQSVYSELTLNTSEF